MKEVVIFGIGDSARLAKYYFENDTNYTVAAFTVDTAYIESDTYLGKPLVAFETVESSYPPERYNMFVAVGYSQVNKVRAEKYHAAKTKGYHLVSYISSKATRLTEDIGDNCFILEDNTLQPFTRIGNNVTLWSGNHIGHDVVIDDHCFIASHIVVSGHTVVEPYCFIGVNATLRNDIRIGAESVIGAGAVILKDVPPKSVVSVKSTEPRNFTSDKLKVI